MKAIYPWAEMNVGDVREVSTHRSRKAVYSAAWEYSKKHPNEDGSRPKFKVKEMLSASLPDADFNWYSYFIERTA